MWAQGRCWLNHCSYSKQTSLFSDQSWILLLTVKYCAFSLDKITMSLRKTPLIAQWVAGRIAECYCLSVTWGECLQFYVSSGRVRWFLLLQQMWGYHRIEWKICMLFFRVKWHCKEISHFCCGCFRLHLHPLEIKFTLFALTGSSGGCFEMWWNSIVKDMNHSVGSHSKPQTYSLVLKIQTNQNQHDLSWEMIPAFLPSSLWQTWCAAGKSHFHKCFIPLGSGIASLEHEFWPAWLTNIFPRAYPFSFAVTVAPPAEMTGWKELLCLLPNPLPESLPGSVFMFFSQSQDEQGFLSFLLGCKHREILLLLTSIPI